MGRNPKPSDAGWVPPALATAPDPDGGVEFTEAEWEDFRRAMTGSTDAAPRHTDDGNVDA